MRIGRWVKLVGYIRPIQWQFTVGEILKLLFLSLELHRSRSVCTIHLHLVFQHHILKLRLT
jgi:hypothetical protein